MIKIIEQEIIIDESLKKKLEFICNFCNTTPTFINGSIRKIDNTYLSYIEPHRVIINNITFLAFNYSNDIYIKNLSNKIKTLTESNDALSLRVSSLEKKINIKDTEIEDLREENKLLKNSLNQLKNKFTKLIKLIKDKIFSKKDTRDKYIDFSRDLYTHGIIDVKEMYDIKTSFRHRRLNLNTNKFIYKMYEILPEHVVDTLYIKKGKH